MDNSEAPFDVFVRFSYPQSSKEKMYIVRFIEDKRHTKRTVLCVVVPRPAIMLSFYFEGLPIRIGDVSRTLVRNLPRMCPGAGR